MIQRHHRRKKSEPKRKVVLSIAFAGIGLCPRPLVFQIQRSGCQEREVEDLWLGWRGLERFQGGDQRKQLPGEVNRIRSLPFAKHKEEKEEKEDLISAELREGHQAKTRCALLYLRHRVGRLAGFVVAACKQYNVISTPWCSLLQIAPENPGINEDGRSVAPCGRWTLGK